MYGILDAFIEGQETGNTLRYDPSADTVADLWQRFNRQIKHDTIDYINAHATGTQAGDAYECDQLSKAFGKKMDDVPVSSTKGFTGHLLGASGAVEAGICLLCMREGIVPPTLHHAEYDPACRIDCVPNYAREKKLKRVVSQSMGFGGHVGIISFIQG
ncbi:MAG: hypothetical protein GY706_00760 [Bacteroides sp.]|nr:hypothetical protein [Bacteroides sp.]